MKVVKIDIVKDYLALIAKFETNPEKYTNLLHSEFSQIELPNVLNKNGQKSTYDNVFQRMKVGSQILKSQSYEIVSVTEQGERAVVEAVWTGVMAVDAGALKKNQSLKAYFCIIFEFKDGKIIHQKNYDCFESF